MQLSQSMAAKSHKVVCAHATEAYGSARSMNSGCGVRLAASYTPLDSPTYTASRPSLLDNPPSLHPYSCIPLSWYGTSIKPLLERGMTPPIKHDIRSPPLLATSRCHLVDNDQWRYERASNPNLGSLTIRTAPVSNTSRCHLHHVFSTVAVGHLDQLP